MMRALMAIPVAVSLLCANWHGADKDVPALAKLNKLSLCPTKNEEAHGVHRRCMVSLRCRQFPRD